MALTAEGYFEHVKECLNPKFIQDNGQKQTIKLVEKIQGAGKREVKFDFEGEAFSINLDLKQTKQGEDPRLFRFLEDDAKPWAKKCDFVIFHRMPVGIYAYLIEFKSNSIDGPGIKAQLDASLNWLKSLKRIVEYYYSQDHELNVQKFVFSSNTNPGDYLDKNGKYLKADPSIRFYHYDDLPGLTLSELENTKIESV